MHGKPTAIGACLVFTLDDLAAHSGTPTSWHQEVSTLPAKAWPLFVRLPYCLTAFSEWGGPVSECACRQQCGGADGLHQQRSGDKGAELRSQSAGTVALSSAVGSLQEDAKLAAVLGR